MTEIIPKLLNFSVFSVNVFWHSLDVSEEHMKHGCL